jgi:phosphoglycerol transferase MdoB-like AlkP superfamily enzyme
MMNNLVLNSSFTLIQTVKRQSLPRDQFFSSEEMLKWLRFGQGEKSLLEGHRPTQKPNVVLIIMESMGLEYMGRPHGDKGYTPFLDELSQKSLFFPNTFANARRSIEGIGAVMGGIPALMNEPFISSQYLTNYFLGIGTRLQSSGYHTSFFHGAQNGSMYFDQFMKSAGVKNYFGRNEYPTLADDDGTWGIFDEPFLQWMNQQLSTFPQPFFSAVFTLSSHHPFTVPKAYEGQFPKGTSEIHETIGYTDMALRKFFESAQKEPWFQNTVFILTADHTYKPSRPEYQNDLGLYRIPLIIYAPGLQLPRPPEDQVVQQTDILPTILDLLGIPENEHNYLGTSVFVPGDRFAVNFFDGHYLFVTKENFLTHNRGGDFELYSIQDPDQKHALTDTPEKKEEMTNRLKAVIQYFSQGMWDNKLYYPSGR